MPWGLPVVFDWLRRLGLHGPGYGLERQAVLGTPEPGQRRYRLRHIAVEGGHVSVAELLPEGQPEAPVWPWVREGVMPDATVKPAIERYNAEGKVERLLLRPA